MDDSSMDDLRRPWEGEEMWNIRRAFLERYWTDKNMTRNRLISLSQIFINIEFLGCRYDESLMDKAKEMGDGLTEEHHQRRREVVQKLFGKTETGAAKDDNAFKVPSKRRRFGGDTDGSTEKKSKPSNAAVIVTTTDPECATRMKILQGLKAELMVMQHQRLPDDPLTVLNQACNRAKCRWRIQFDDEKHFCYVQIADVLIMEQVYWGSQSRSRQEACRRVVDILQRPFFDVRPVQKIKTANPVGDLEMELYTRKEARGDWDPPSTAKFDPLETAFTGLRKRLVAVQQESRMASPEACFRNAAQQEDLPVDVKRQHLGGWKEEIIISVGKVEFCRHQGRVPPKGKEQESLHGYFQTAMDFILKPAFGEGIGVTEENGVLSILAKAKTVEKPAAASSTPAPVVQRQRSRDQCGNDLARKELTLKSVRLHLNATSDSMNPIQRIEKFCCKANANYEIQQIDTGTPPFNAACYVEGVRIGSGIDATKKGAKIKACQDTIDKLRQAYVRIKQNDSGELILDSSSDPFTDQ